MTKNNKSILTCSTGTASSTKEQTLKSDQFVLTVKITAKEKLIIIEIYLKKS